MLQASPLHPFQGHAGVQQNEGASGWACGGPKRWVGRMGTRLRSRSSTFRIPGSDLPRHVQTLSRPGDRTPCLRGSHWGSGREVCTQIPMTAWCILSEELVLASVVHLCGPEGFMGHCCCVPGTPWEGDAVWACTSSAEMMPTRNPTTFPGDCTVQRLMREVSWFGGTSCEAVRTSVPMFMGGLRGSCAHGHPGHGQCSLRALPTPSQPSEGARRARLA